MSRCGSGSCAPAVIALVGTYALVKVPLYRLRSALSRLWQHYPPCFAAFLPLASLSVGKVLQLLPLPSLMKGSVTSLLRLIPSALFSLPTFTSSPNLTPKIRHDSCIITLDMLLLTR